MFDFIKSDDQKVKDRLPAECDRFDNLIRSRGEEGLSLWLQELADLGGLLRASRMQYLVEGRTGSSVDWWEDAPSIHAGIWRGWTGEKTPDRELDWWAMRAVWNGVKAKGDVIDGGPDEVPGLWDKEFNVFYRWHRTGWEEAEKERADQSE